MPSSSIVASFRPHIGSEVGGGTRFGVIPESQCPALPAQHGIVSDDALAIGKSGTMNERATKRHKKHNTALESCLYFMNFFVIIKLPNVVEPGRFGVGRMFLLRCSVGDHRIHRESIEKQSNCERVSLPAHALILREQEEC